MPRRQDLHSILVIGAGPIVIGQACEFDYSSSQACKALKEEGYRVVLINSNPASIMTDPHLADATYIEPITTEVVRKIIRKERPDALLPTLAGQTGLNMALALEREKVLEEYSVELLGVNIRAIETAENRSAFRESMQKIGLPVTKSLPAHTVEEALSVAEVLGFPLIIRSSFTLGGTGGAVVFHAKDLEAHLTRTFTYVRDVLLEESLLGWKEFELELIRDAKDTIIVVCSIENVDPVGIHTGDSVTVAPQQTLSDKEYQNMRDASFKIIREIGVEAGGANIQFAVNPNDGRMIVIEMNPRVSRSSALASKATGFPIAKVAAKLSVGYTLDELPNDITKKTQAAFEPSLDYCVVKIPRWDFSKFPKTHNVLSIQMQSIGEVMGIGRTFKEAFQKAIQSLEIDKAGFENELYRDQLPEDSRSAVYAQVKNFLSRFGCFGFFHVKDALNFGMTLEELASLTRIDLFFLYQFQELCNFEASLKQPLSNYDATLMTKAKQYGFSDLQIARFTDTSEETVRQTRKAFNVLPTYKIVDSCAAEFESLTPYCYSTYEDEDESFPSSNKKVLILGSGPNRIGQGIEFDYLCVQCSYALRELGYETIMLNSNPETVSTDYDTSDKLYFEPLTFEHILNVYEKEQPLGVILQLGGQTPLNIASRLESAGVRILGTSPSTIHMVEDRQEFQRLLQRCSFLQPKNTIALSEQDLTDAIEHIGYPVILRPSYVLGGRSMKIVYDAVQLQDYLNTMRRAKIQYPILVDEFLQNAIEVDVDGISDGETVTICGIMEHIEEAGIHSGDSACVLPPYNISERLLQDIRFQVLRIAQELSVKGFLNVQFAIYNDAVYFLEVNLRGSRSVPFVSKATGVNWTRLASAVMLGAKLSEYPVAEKSSRHISVKEVVLPFVKFPLEDAVLGPEMKSTGEVMGVDSTFGKAFAKSQIAAGTLLPKQGNIFISIDDYNKSRILNSCLVLYKLGFSFFATRNTAQFLREHNIHAQDVRKLHEGSPHLLDYIAQNQIQLIVNTPNSRQAVCDGQYIRQAAIIHSIPLITTITGFIASVEAIQSLVSDDLDVVSLQELR